MLEVSKLNVLQEVMLLEEQQLVLSVLQDRLAQLGLLAQPYVYLDLILMLVLEVVQRVQSDHHVVEEFRHYALVDFIKILLVRVLVRIVQQGNM